MLNSKLTLAALATALDTTAAVASTEIGSVDVRVDLDAIGNERAAQYWTDVADDLEEALVARLTNQIVEEGGASVSVDINELSLATAFEEDFGIEDTKLTGQVSVQNLFDQSVREFYELTVNYDQAARYFPTADGVIAVQAITDQGYYDGMIDAFADNIVAKLQ